MAMKMWSLFRQDKIQELLKNSFAKKSTLTLWQHSTQQMFQLKGSLTSVGEDNCEVVLTEKWEEGQINPTEALYFHCDEVGFIFKREKFTFDTGELSFKTPSELMIGERRRIQRFTFRYQDFKSVSFETRNPGEDGEEIIKANFNLVDLSTAGLAFVGAAKDINRFSEGEILYITHITDQVIENACKAQVISVEDFEAKKGLKDRGSVNDQRRVGVEFKEALESVSIKSVQSIVNRTQKRTRGLEIDGFNGLNDIEQLRIVKKVGEENPVLANHLLENIETLDRLKYLTSEMKQRFWLEVNQDVLAAALRLSSKELIYDLLNDVTDRMREEFLYKLDVPKSPSAIDKAQRQICDFIHQKEKEGLFVLSPESFVKYV
jgi:hypothetical protein